MADQKTSPSLPRPRRAWIKTIILGMVILISGMVIGSVLTLKILWGRSVENMVNPTAASDRIASRMARRLDLNAEQKAQLRIIVAKHMKKFQQIRRQVQPALSQALEDARADIKPILTPEQAEKFEQDFSRLKRRWNTLAPPGKTLP